MGWLKRLFTRQQIEQKTDNPRYIPTGNQQDKEPYQEVSAEEKENLLLIRQLEGLRFSMRNQPRSDEAEQNFETEIARLKAANKGMGKGGGHGI
ncbi:hypothetical protein ES702_07202 [subsurface metagenome]